MTDAEQRQSPRFDPTVANVARIYDYVLGGKNNFAADRAVGEYMLGLAPELRDDALEGRKFLTRSVRFLAETGIRQFIDIGCGLPTQGNVHEVAQAVAPEARVIYADNDPVVVAHARALLENNPYAVAIRGDVADIPAIFADPAVGRHLDLTQPVAALMFNVLHVISDDAVCQRAVDQVRTLVPDGSYLAISHTVSDVRPDLFAKLTLLYQEKVDISGPRRANQRSLAEVMVFFRGLDLVEPGVVFAPHWRPDAADVNRGLPESTIVGGVGRKSSAS